MLPYNECDGLDKEKRSKQLWESLCSGNRKALDQLFRLYYQPLYNYGIKLISDSETVKDGIQKLFLRLWKRHGALSQAQSVKGYLLSSLRRILLRIKERRRSRYKRNKVYLGDTFSKAFPAEEIMVSMELNRDKKKQLCEAINSLSGRPKEAIFLRYNHGLSIDEIAQVMSINKQSVSNHLSRAIKSLRILLQGMSWTG